MLGQLTSTTLLLRNFHKDLLWNTQESTLGLFTITEMFFVLEDGQIVLKRDATGTIYSKTSGSKCQNLIMKEKVLVCVSLEMNGCMLLEL
jgi:hypothetical protein